MNALRPQQQLHRFENVRLIVGGKYPDWLFLTGDGDPPALNNALL
jgi:hypothetical protein